jgi:beta-glucanase (GH16 family)
MKTYKVLIVLFFPIFLLQCASESSNTQTPEKVEETPETNQLIVEAESFNSSSDSITKTDIITLDSNNWAVYQIEIPETGRYRVSILGSAAQESLVWIEDYINNKDGRTYDITGKIGLTIEDQMQFSSKDGSPLQKGTHDIKLHSAKGLVNIDKIKFELIQKHTETPTTMKQNMEGTEWALVWSDEFETNGLPDSSKWAYNIGNWGWGNNELQYYTKNQTENARVEDGNLVIEAHEQPDGSWTSARLSTQGKTSFTYGKIEFKAKVPKGRGTWAAGWLLGDAYRDEVSWPYCGEIDVLECVGYEINDTTEHGLNHATCHTRAYYFKQGNQIGSEIELDSMESKFHVYAVEWYPNEIKGYLDGEHYFTYDKTADELEWPFNNPQNIIVNLALGGGWGGAQGLDPELKAPKFILDYVRVYELK